MRGARCGHRSGRHLSKHLLGADFIQSSARYSSTCQTLAENLLWAEPGAAPQGPGAESRAPRFHSRKENEEVREVPPRPLLFVAASQDTSSVTNRLQKQCNRTEHLRQNVKSEKLKYKRKAENTMGKQCKCHVIIIAQKPFPSLRVPKCYPAATF